MGVRNGDVEIIGRIVTVEDRVYYGREEEVEVVNWEEQIKAHQEELEREEAEKNMRLRKQATLEGTWELTRVCVKFLEDNNLD